MLQIQIYLAIICLFGLLAEYGGMRLTYVLPIAYIGTISFSRNKQVWLDAQQHKNRKNFKISWIAWASFWIRLKVIQLFPA